MYIYMYIYTHFSQAGDVSRCFPSSLLISRRSTWLAVPGAASTNLGFERWDPRGGSEDSTWDVSNFYPDRELPGEDVFWILMKTVRMFWKKSWSLSSKLCLLLCFSWFYLPVFQVEVFFRWCFLHLWCDGFWSGLGKHPLRGAASELWRCSTEITVKKIPQPGNWIVWYIDVPFLKKQKNTKFRTSGPNPMNKFLLGRFLIALLSIEGFEHFSASRPKLSPI